MRTRTIALASSALVALLVLAGCSGTDNSMPGMDHGTDPMPDSSETEFTFNDPDVAFAMNMIAHHQQAIDMSDTILAKDGVDERVLDLAADIKDAQGPEIETMTSWLEEWGQSADMGGMDHGGMMSDDDMAALEAATGPDASRLFLEQMIVHHTGAIDMAEEELANGENPDATALAAKVVSDQTAEIQTMQDLLASL
jgi:uncharacterized protein (DUF305 family)